MRRSVFRCSVGLAWLLVFTPAALSSPASPAGGADRAPDPPRAAGPPPEPRQYREPAEPTAEQRDRARAQGQSGVDVGYGDELRYPGRDGLQVPLVFGRGSDPIAVSDDYADEASQRARPPDLESETLPASHAGFMEYGGNWAVGQPWGLLPALHEMVCAGPYEKQYILVYAYKSTVYGGNGNRYGAAAQRAANLWKRTNNYLAHQSVWQGGPLMKIRTYCAGVQSVDVGNTSDLRQIWRQVRDQLQLQPYHKAFVFADFRDDRGRYGVGYGNLRFHDVSGAGNLNNKPYPLDWWNSGGQSSDPNDQCSDMLGSGTIPCNYGIIYDSWGDYSPPQTGGLGLMHELMHTMGAVQRTAPNEYQANFGHCFDGIDVMCYGLASNPGVSDGVYDDRFCVPQDPNTAYSFRDIYGDVGGQHLPPLDCVAWWNKSRTGIEGSNGDPTDYFWAGAPVGSNYVDSHWNTGRGYHGFILRGDGSP